MVGSEGLHFLGEAGEERFQAVDLLPDDGRGVRFVCEFHEARSLGAVKAEGVCPLLDAGERDFAAIGQVFTRFSGEDVAHNRAGNAKTMGQVFLAEAKRRQAFFHIGT